MECDMSGAELPKRCREEKMSPNIPVMKLVIS